MHPGLRHLQPYPFERLNTLRKGVTPNPALAPIVLHIGEPQHAAPAFVLQTLRDKEAAYGNYPASKGITELRNAIAAWLTRRFQLPVAAVDPERNVLPAAGTREALFAVAQCVVDRTERAAVVMPNPFYQIYEGAALLAGAQPVYLNCTADNGFLPNYGLIPEAIWRRTQLIYVCSPGNPTGRVESTATFRKLLELSDRYGFVIASDECYSEIYPDEGNPPPGLLQACAEIGRTDFKNCLVFHSLSKRSNLPGLRSGFIAGDAALLEKFLLYRTYQGCALPVPVQHASAAAWADEAHVRANRDAYRAKFEAVLPILAPVLTFRNPDAAFYVWAETPIADDEFSLRLYRDQNVSVLPGRYLSRESKGVVPGKNHVRLSLTAPLDQCVEAAGRIAALVKTL
jgi:N-succinyldiaminopimelate aminotransferase